MDLRIKKKANRIKIAIIIEILKEKGVKST
jgi:hypothetical protein